MNWRRGLFRVWILTSILWVASCPLLARPHAWSVDCVYPTSSILWCEAFGRSDLPRLLRWMAAVPFALLMAGIAILWTIKGFRSNQDTTSRHGHLLREGGTARQAAPKRSAR